MKHYILIIILIYSFSGCTDSSSSTNEASSESSKTNIFLADPMVLSFNGSYYLYGTRFASKGILAYESTDLKNWEGPVGATGGFALKKGDTYGSKKFMGAYVLRKDNRFYFFYVTDQQIAVATSDFPTGPFTQTNENPLNIEGKAIAPHVFIDDDGKKYLYYTKLDHGNKIYVAELNDDLQSVKEGTAKECLHVTEPWENTADASWPVAEGAAVLKHKDTYYLFYTANDYRNPDYNVGYATSSSPMGPWTKYDGNPILKKTPKAVGMGSNEFIRNDSNELVMFYHTHYNREKVHPRKTVFSKGEFVIAGKDNPDVFKMESKKHFIYRKNE